MKRLLALLMILCMASLVVCGCKSSNPKNINEKLYEKGKKAVEITEKYLDTDLSAKEACSKMKRLEAQTKRFTNSDNYDESSVALSIGLLVTEFVNAELSEDEGDYSEEKDIQETLNDLKKELGEE